MFQITEQQAAAALIWIMLRDVGRPEADATDLGKEQGLRAATGNHKWM
jgi:hypothetical protein